MTTGDPRNTADELNHSEKPRKRSNLELLVAIDIHEFYEMHPQTTVKAIALLDTIRAVAINALGQRGYALDYGAIKQ